MISFYPGPSRVYDEIPLFVKDAHRLGIMGINHRSAAFMKMLEQTVKLLKSKLEIPSSYTVFFTSSATECWEIIAQSLISKKSHHIYNGAFGERWFDYTKRLKPAASPYVFHPEDELSAVSFIFPGANDVICITQNETSNGTQVSNHIIKEIRKNNPFHIIAVDATSSMAGIKLDFKNADIWFASVQKCFGLPAGMGIMVCSKNALSRAEVIKERNHYNSLHLIIEKMKDWQTPYTPNVLGIYLLMRVMEQVKPINDIHEQTLNRYEHWVDFFSNGKSIKFYIHNNGLRSNTVLTLSATPKLIQKIKKLTADKGMLLGEGYGRLKADTFRIANFPAIKDNEIRNLKKLLQPHL